MVYESGKVEFSSHKVIISPHIKTICGVALYTYN